MNEVKIIEIKKSVFEDNDRDADRLRSQLKQKGVYLLNLMSAPGSGKTTTLIQTINRLKDKIRIAVMEADIDSDVDAIKIKQATGVDSIQLHTGGMCHLDAEMTRQGLVEVVESLELNVEGSPKDESGKFKETPDLVILENVGNLVCPAEFDTGAVRNAMILSVPEGDLVVINKIDVMPYFDFNLEKCKQYIHSRNPKATVIPICAKTGEGVDQFADWLLNEVKNFKEHS